MVVDGAHGGAEVYEAAEEDPPWGDDLAGKGKFADKGEELAFGAGAFGVEG